jgi:signal transduction histidine kinase
MAHPRLSVLGKIVALALVYVVTARLGLMLDAVSGFATLVWAPTGISLAAVLLLGYAVAPAVFLGAFLVNFWIGAPAVVALGIAVGNTLEALLGAYAMRRFAGYRGSFDRLRHVVGLIVFGAASSTLVSATLGVASLGLDGHIPSQHFRSTWQAWWIGDALGDLVMGALLLAWATRGSAAEDDLARKPRRIAEALLMGAAFAVATVAVFRRPSFYPFESSLMLLFAWASVRFKLRGATTATALVSIFAIWSTVNGSGPFVRGSLAENLIALQTFLGGVALAPLLVGGAASDRARAIRSRDRFMASVSHDLKTPLQAIQLSAASLLDKLAGVSTAEVERHGALVQRSVDRMAHLVSDLSDAAALDAERLSIELGDVDARVLVEEAVRALQPLADAKKQDLVLELPIEVSVRCDRKRIVQVLANLVANAIKFSREGGAIAVGVVPLPRSARIFVRDQGVGIDPADLARIFELHWHAPTAAGGGTGLGLFLAKGIVEAHGGRLWVKSKPLAGAEFSFTLPLGEERAASSVHPAEVVGRRRAPRLRELLTFVRRAGTRARLSRRRAHPAR